MKSSCKRHLRFAAITCIGLAGSAVAAFAQTPAPVAPRSCTCNPGEWHGHVGHGVNDSFAGGNNEPTNPSPEFRNVPGLNLTQPANVYDQTASNYHFGDTLSFNPPPGFKVTKACLTTRLKANTGDATNDGIDFASHRWPPNGPNTGARVAFAIQKLPGVSQPWAPPQPPVLFHFTFLPSHMDIIGNTTPGTDTTAAPNPPYVGSTFFQALNANKRLDIYVQDDTSVDFTDLQICAH
jgi:hypothetical protein